MDRKLIYRGAEAELYKTSYLDMEVVEKQRISKKYRIAEIDNKIRKNRVKRECNMIKQARNAVNTPFIYDVDMAKMSLTMQFIDGDKVRDVFYKGEQIESISKQMGNGVKKLHDLGLIHGDLTTSNVIRSDKELYFIDFGLAFKSEKLEDKAVDLVTFKKMLKSTHYKYFDKIWNNFKKEYDDQQVFKRIEKVEKRARYA